MSGLAVRMLKWTVEEESHKCRGKGEVALVMKSYGGVEVKVCPRIHG
jgi:hypothetical protein